MMAWMPTSGRSVASHCFIRSVLREYDVDGVVSAAQDLTSPAGLAARLLAHVTFFKFFCKACRYIMNSMWLGYHGYVTRSDQYLYLCANHQISWQNAHFNLYLLLPSDISKALYSFLFHASDVMAIGQFCKICYGSDTTHWPIKLVRSNTVEISLF
ncbi:hypothetical protein BDR22DRAFT_224966 [Usnea florida]